MKRKRIVGFLSILCILCIGIITWISYSKKIAPLLEMTIHPYHFSDPVYYYRVYDNGLLICETGMLRSYLPAKIGGVLSETYLHIEVQLKDDQLQQLIVLLSEMTTKDNIKAGQWFGLGDAQIDIVFNGVHSYWYREHCDDELHNKFIEYIIDLSPLDVEYKVGDYN